MEGTFPTLCKKTKQEKAGWDQSGNGSLGRSALSRPGVEVRGQGEVPGPGGTSQTGSAGVRAGSLFEDLRGPF